MIRTLPVRTALDCAYAAMDYKEEMDVDFDTIRRTLIDRLREAALEDGDVSVKLGGPYWAILDAFHQGGGWAISRLLNLEHHIEALAQCKLDDRQIRLACQAVQDAAMGDEIDDVIGRLIRGRQFRISNDQVSVSMPQVQWFIIWLMMIIGDHFSLSFSSENRDKGVTHDVEK